MSYDGFNQSNAIRIILQTNIDFTTEAPTSQKILYIKPDSDTIEEWTASVLSGAETEGKIYYDMTTSDALETGTWTLRAKLTYADSRVLYTKWATMEVGD